jgi:hypothetical protein
MDCFVAALLAMTGAGIDSLSRKRGEVEEDYTDTA